jgi:hypothetical protein
MFKPPTLCHIAIRVEAYKAQIGLTQCYNCQKFGHVWAHCKQPPGCMWCGSGHLHKEFPEKGNAASIPTCCNCKLVDGEEPHPSTYRGCSRARDEMQKRTSQRPLKATSGRVFLSNHTTPSFAAALRSNTQHQQQPRPPSVAQACPATVGEMSARLLLKHN